MASLFFAEMTPEEAWIPLVDGPIGAIVERVQEDHPEIGELIDSPSRLLAFRTFAYIRVGILLGRLLVDYDVEGEDWVERLLDDPDCYDEVVREVLAVAEDTADEPGYDRESSVGPSDEERERFSEFAKRLLSTDT
jgi:transglutaminase-like putative cysteine protease